MSAPTGNFGPRQGASHRRGARKNKNNYQVHQLATAVPVALAVTVKDPIVLFDDGVSTQVAPEVTAQRHMRPLLGLRVPLVTRDGPLDSPQP